MKSPTPVLERSDSKELRERILGLSASEARRLGLSKSTVHYLKKHARDSRPFKIYNRVGSKLRALSTLGSSLINRRVYVLRS